MSEQETKEEGTEQETPTTLTESAMYRVRAALVDVVDKDENRRWLAEKIEEHTARLDERPDRVAVVVGILDEAADPSLEGLGTKSRARRLKVAAEQIISIVDVDRAVIGGV